MPLSVQALAITEVRLLVPDRFHDERGYFSETYSRRDFAAAGITDEFIQDNHSLSTKSGTIRGLHYQLAPLCKQSWSASSVAQFSTLRLISAVGRRLSACMSPRR